MTPIRKTMFGERIPLLLRELDDRKPTAPAVLSR